MQGLVCAYMFELNCLFACSAYEASYESLPLNNFCLQFEIVVLCRTAVDRVFLIIAEARVEQQKAPQGSCNIRLLASEGKAKL